MVAYAILKHRLMDIEVIIKKTLVFAGLLAFVFGVFAAVSFLVQDVLSTYVGVSRPISLFISVLIIVLGYDGLRAWLVHVTENVLFQKEIDYEALDREIADQIQITDLEEQVRNIAEIFQMGFLLENTAVFLLEEEKKIFRLAHAVGYGRMPETTEIAAGGEALAAIKEHPQTVILKSSLQEKGKADVLNFFLIWKAETVCKITFKDAMIAFLLLGRKKSDQEITQRDLDFLDKVSKSLAVSINNAKSFRFKENYYLLMAEKNKTDVLARLSEGIEHEIKNPLNAIKPAAQRIQMALKKRESEEGGGAGALDGDGELTAKIGEYSDMIIRNTDRITAIMARLRNFARPIRSSSDFKLEPLRLKTFVDEAIELVSRKQLELDGVVIENEVDDGICIFGERSSVVQVFWNLIVNAYHAVDRNGKIAISAQPSERDGKVIVEVTDTGRGISPENMEKVFTPFFTTKPTNLPTDGSARFTGTGLGLCYVKQYVESLGGSIKCESRLNEGTSFYMKFLRADHYGK